MGFSMKQKRKDKEDIHNLKMKENRFLGNPCPKHGHIRPDGFSLRYKANNRCVACQLEYSRSWNEQLGLSDGERRRIGRRSSFDEIELPPDVPQVDFPSISDLIAGRYRSGMVNSKLHRTDARGFYVNPHYLVKLLGPFQDRTDAIKMFFTLQNVYNRCMKDKQQQQPDIRSSDDERSYSETEEPSVN